MGSAEFLSLAERLLKIPSEAAYRTAVNRAYYATFHCGNDFLAKLGFRASIGPQAHGQLQARANNSGVLEFEKFYKILHRLYDRRRLADYDLSSREFHSQAAAALWVASAKQALAIIAQCEASEALRQRIRKGVEEYEKKLKA
ncbi:MAG: hypothetical protein AAB354_11965 [candidate division KSB1 bacterium]